VPVRAPARIRGKNGSGQGPGTTTGPAHGEPHWKQREGEPMRAAGRWLVVCWLVAALVLLGLDGRLPVLAAWAVPGSLLGLGICSFIRQQRAPSICDRPFLPDRYRTADDLRLPLTEVVAAAEREAESWR
jgi:hypothetical protein